MKKSIFVLTFLIISASSAFASPAHTFHTSLTRMDYNAKEKLVEISIQLFTHDLVPALERFAKKNVDLEKTPDIDKLILKYLDENFILKDGRGETKKLVWVGKEHKVETTYVYVEIPLSENFDGYALRNTIFFETFQKQANLVVARFNEKKVDLIYNVGDGEKLISPQNKTEE